MQTFALFGAKKT